jgi:hypothetical protein
MPRGIAYITLAGSHGDMRYCFTSCRESIGGRQAKTVYQGEMFVSTHTRSTVLGIWCICALFVCIASTTAWSDWDKTRVDLQRGLPEAPSLYHRPRAAHLYHYDRTEVDLAVPIQRPPAEAPSDAQRPATLPAPGPALTTPPYQAPRQEGGR